MSIARPSVTDITNRIYNKLKTQTALTAGLDSSIIGVIVKIIAAELDLVWSSLDDQDTQADPTTATGGALDQFGLLFGVPRNTDTAASTSGLTPAVRFTNLGVASVIVPSGTRVYSSANTQVAYFTSQGVTIPAGSTGDVDVIAANTGEFYNVAVGQLDSSNFPSTSVTVRNILPIQNGSSLESDDSYRQRILQDITRRDVLNLSNMDALMRSVPGVQDVIILNFYRGAGTFDVIVIPYLESATNSVVASCNALLNTSVPIGINAIARPPTYRQLDVIISLTFDPTSSTDPNTVRQQIVAQITSLVSNLAIEDGSGVGSFNVGQINAIALQSDSSVLNANTSLGLDGSSIANTGIISLNVGERLVLRTLSVQ